MTWKPQDRVKVIPEHYGTGLATRLGTVLRITPSGLVEVVMDSMRGTNCGIVAFKPVDLVETKTPRYKYSPRKEHVDS